MSQVLGVIALAFGIFYGARFADKVWAFFVPKRKKPKLKVPPYFKKKREFC